MAGFDHTPDRRGTSSQKWDKYEQQDVIPMWVADTDFPAPPAVIQALQGRVNHGVFGYTLAPRSLSEAIVERMARLYDWQIQPEWIVYLPGLVCGLNLACRSFGDSGSPVCSPLPVYPKFTTAPRQSDRQLLSVPMQLQEGRWLLDLAALEQQLAQHAPALLLLCNPHNPGGTVYRREELQALAALCQRYNTLICSDEVHCDLLLEPGLCHTPIASLSEDANQRTLTLMAPSKAFNVAGLACSFAIVANPEWRQRLKRVMRGIVPDVNLLGYTAAEAAYRHGDDWLSAQNDYLRGNRDLLMERINAIPGLRLHPIEATYLAWIDCSALALDNPQQFFERHGVGMSPGKDFGNGNFVRLNFGCSRALLEQAINRMEQAVASLA
ncbi:MalY/PatB family protein [Balneatrix alpica]|uniref:cysteine-S-conjugate beta-lyase n=1 Tax=Balneatrix alpica TaxID=75684 RepID=A0ABV5ZC42_9GAMM|nr:PatB family C-S lyase [Balneatrix alpica]